MDKKIQIFIVDDHELFRLGVSSALISETQIEVLAEADSGEQLLKLLEHNITPDVIILDIIMPGMGGLEAAQKIKKDYPNIKIILLSAENTQEIINKAIEIGIDGFISKSDTTKELANAIKSIVQQGEPFYGNTISKIMHEVLITKEIVYRDDKRSMFSKRELQIIEACTKGLTAKETSEKLFISKRTVEWHRNKIFKKLGINNHLDLIKYALKHHIVVFPPIDSLSFYHQK